MPAKKVVAKKPEVKKLEVEKPVVTKKPEVKKAAVKKKASKPMLEMVEVCKDENGKNGTLVKGYVDPDRTRVTTEKGITYSLI